MWTWFHKFGSPKHFYRISGACLPWLVILTGALLLIGLVWGLAIAPIDYQQGDSYRIIFIHVPSAFLSMSTYVMMAVAAIVYLVWNMKIADWVIKAAAPIGAGFTLVALVTGSLWGKPTWGTYWAWDARLVSELILLFLYIGIIALRNAIVEDEMAAKAVAILAVVGVINIPIIHYSVYIWNSIHQGATISDVTKPKIHSSMAWPLVIMIFAYMSFMVSTLFMRLRNLIIWNERKTSWVKQEVLK